MAEEQPTRPGQPVVTGLSPTEGNPGTIVTIRGENLGSEQSDLLMLIICGVDCLHTARWKSPSKIVARIGRANRGLGEVKIATKSGGRGVSNVKFRVLIRQIGPTEESPVWVDETTTVPGRGEVAEVLDTSGEFDALGLRPQRRFDLSVLAREFPDSSTDLRMPNFNAQMYLLENHAETSLDDLRRALVNMERAKLEDVKKSEDMHKANLYSLIDCMETLVKLREMIEAKYGNKEFSDIRKVEKQIESAKTKAEGVFHDVLSRKDRADATRNALSLITRNKFLFYLSKNIDENMKKGEYLTILNDYTRVKAIYKDTHVQLFKEVLAELDKKMDAFKEEMKRKLILDTPVTYEEQSKLIKYLKILDPNSDPAWDCIESYYRWLEKMLWDLQTDYAEKAAEKEHELKNSTLQNGTSRQERFAVETNERQTFISEMVSMLLSKLPSFWKLSNNYNTNDEKWRKKRADVNEMLTKIVNVSSWLTLNAIAPWILPEKIAQQYESQFAKWPEISENAHRTVLMNSVKTLRSLISSLMSNNFTSEHLQPLTELCMALRVIAINKMQERAVENIVQLGRKATWKQDVIEKGIAKTILPDMFENEVIECVNSLREVLSTSGYPSEQCLFSRERFKTTIIELLAKLLTSIKSCFDRLLNIREDSQGKRPEALALKTDGKIDGKQQSGYAMAKKLLICICDLEYIVENSLRRVGKQMEQVGVKCIDIIKEKAATKLSAYRQTLVKCYITSKSSVFDSIIDSATYDWMPDDDVSDYAKEVMMCCVVQQSEMELCAPQLTVQSLQEVVNYAFSKLMDHFSTLQPDSEDTVTQIVIDVCALEEALSSYTNFETKARLNSFRKAFVGQFDQEKLANCLKTMRTTMRLVLDSLYRDIADLDSSNV